MKFLFFRMTVDLYGINHLKNLISMKSLNDEVRKYRLEIISSNINDNILNEKKMHNVFKP